MTDLAIAWKRLKTAEPCEWIVSSNMICEKSAINIALQCDPLHNDCKLIAICEEHKREAEVKS